jgi:ribosome-binding factor A
MGLRQERLAHEMRDILASCFFAGKMEDPRLQGITITHVKLTADLQLASVYYRLFVPSEKEAAVLGLERCAGHLRKVLAEELKMRRVPVLRFFYDESIETGSRIEDLLSRVR